LEPDLRHLEPEFSLPEAQEGWGRSPSHHASASLVAPPGFFWGSAKGCSKVA